MLKGGIIMDVTNAAQAKIAEEAGVYCVIRVYSQSLECCRLVQ